MHLHAHLRKGADSEVLWIYISVRTWQRRVGAFAPACPIQLGELLAFLYSLEKDGPAAAISRFFWFILNP
jgi:hypothetical protein